MQRKSFRVAARPEKLTKRQFKAEQNKLKAYEQADLEARLEGPQRKHWSIHDLKPLKPANDKQRAAMEAWFEGQSLALLGSTGTGKTALGVYLALTSLLRGEESIERIIIVRSAVQTRNVGFLPGDLKEKIAVYEEPYIEAFAKWMGRASTFSNMKECGKVSFLSTSFLRGMSFDNAIVLIDECQSMTFHELSTVLTRLGHHSRVIMMGDTAQNDLNQKHELSGLPVFMEIVKDIKGFTPVYFNRYDIVRSGFVRSWIIATENYFESLDAHSRSKV
jgi:phosphate starvation-inducible protein PhoH